MSMPTTAAATVATTLAMTKFEKFAKNRVALISLVFILFVIVLAVFAPYVTHFSYSEQSIGERLQSPSLRHWMGTDILGRDLFSRLVFGARMSMAVGIFTALLSLVLGTFFGAIAGFFGGWSDRLIMRAVDLIYIFPSLLLAILLMLFLGRGFVGIYVALGATAWITQARLVRGLFLQAKEQSYVEAARAIGVGDFSIMFHHILPNTWGPIIVSLTMQIPAAIMAESFLSFIGLGLQPPFSSWGTLASEGFRAMRSYPHLIIFPGVVLFVTMIAFNYLGDGLRDLLDPHSPSHFH